MAGALRSQQCLFECFGYCFKILRDTEAAAIVREHFMSAVTPSSASFASQSASSATASAGKDCKNLMERRFSVSNASTVSREV
jgi:hypothetical protein